MYQAFLVKYGEIGLKGSNRHIFENALKNRILDSLRPLGDYTVIREQGRIFVECPEGYDYEDTVEALGRVFGVIGFCPVKVVETTEWETVKQAVGDFVEEMYPQKNFTFKMAAKRADKQYPFTSPEICANMGEYLLSRFDGISVDVHEPQEVITVEIRNRAYIYSKVLAGPGGMPVGTAGKAMLLLSGGIDSPVAGYMISKRGVAIEATYFHAPPYTSDRAKEKVVDLARIVSRYTGPIRLNVVNFTDIQLAIYEKCPHEQLTIIMRRYMMRIAEYFANKSECLGMITGESIGQVASQTMHSLLTTNAVCELPVYRPLIGMDKVEIIDIAQKIGTFETSILPYEDCCTIFVAKHPVTKPILSAIEKSEELLVDVIDDLMKEAIETTEVIEVRA